MHDFVMCGIVMRLTVRAAVAGATVMQRRAAPAADCPSARGDRGRDGKRNAGTLLGQHHPQLTPWEIGLWGKRPRKYSLIMMWFPRSAARRFCEVVAHLHPDTLVIDCGADFRLEEAEPGSGSTVAHAGSWPYGLPELPWSTDKLAGAVRSLFRGAIPRQRPWRCCRRSRTD